MSASVLAAEFHPPSSRDFELPPLIGDIDWATKPVLLACLSVVLIAGFFYLAARRASVVPNKLQFAGEGLYGFVRNGVARDVIGSHDFMKFVPYLVTLFAFILVNNVFGIIPFIQFPTMSRIAFPTVLAVMSWVIFNWIGLRKQGPFAYFKNMMFPPGVPKPVYVLLAPIEFVSTVLVRPLTLALRLFANMFAGHLLLLVFILGGEYLLVHGGAALKVVSIPAFLLGIVLTFFELLVQVLQAYIFTLLSALYIAGALAEEH